MTLSQLRPALVALMIAASAAGAMAQAARKGAGSLLPGSNSKEPVNIEAQKLDYYDRDQKLVYTGNVVAVQGASTLKCTVLVSYLDKPPTGGSGRVRRMEATGPVTITSRDQVGTGDRGVYEKSESKVYLYGNVTLSEGTNVTRGDRLVYDLNTTQAVVHSGQATGGRVRSVFTPSGDEKKKPKTTTPPGQ
jgi:lipopolysaccharide export system protein LptA